jgi:LPS-assembly lipoprotein
MLNFSLCRMAVALFLGAGLLSGCAGYRPLYGGGTDQQAVASELSGIAVREQKTRAGQLVRNELLSVMRGEGDAQFVLDLLPEETSRKVSQPVGQKLERFRYSLKTSYVLRSASGGAALSEGHAFSAVSYDTVEQPVADLQAAENARLRASKEVAEEIRLRLAAFLAAR